MSLRPIGYYVHHRGAGHLSRARAITPLLSQPCTLIGTFDGAPRDDEDRLALPDDAIGPREGDDGEAHRPDSLHYAPLGVPAIRNRMARIAAWIERRDPVMIVSDVSVEVALLARLLSVPTVVVRLAGTRTDRPHLDAFRGAERLVAPFPAAFESAATPTWVCDKTVYAGLLAPPARALPLDMAGGQAPIVVIFGRGGVGGDFAALADAARAVPDIEWDVIGPVRDIQPDRPANLRLHGWVGDVERRLAAACLVVGTAGDGVVAAVAAQGKRFICIPEERPFDEQRVKAEALHRMGAAYYQPHWQADWPRLVAAGLSLDPSRLAGLAAPDGAARVAVLLDGLATDIERRQSPGRDAE